MGTSERLLKLLSLLQTPRDWTGTELAERLEVSPRTVRNDIERLRGLGYPVHATRGSVGGYRLEAGASMPPLLLDDEEAVAVAVGLRTATSGALTGIEETSLRALAKLEQVLPPRLRRQLGALEGVTLHVPHRRSSAAVDAETLTGLARLAREHFTVRFEYSDRTATTSRRHAEPYRIVNAAQRWYLVAWDLDRKDWRTFRVDRMKPGASAGIRFTPRELTDDEVQALVSRGVPPEARRHQARIVIHASTAELTALFGSWVGTIERIDDRSCLLTAGSDRLDYLAANLAMLDVDFQVTEPPELVERVRAIAARFAAAAGPTA
jgi:predicted DNA-binding transcriptional regulator YafY